MHAQNVLYLISFILEAMSAETPQRAVSNGAPDNEEDTFEKDLNEMLQDAPSLNDSCSTVQSGSPRKIATAAAAPPTTFNSNPADSSHTRPYTGPPGEDAFFSLILYMYLVKEN